MAFKGMNRRKGKVNMNPLRKIVKEEMRQLGDSSVEALHEVLECGHAVLPREDFVGRTNAYRRRCWQCGSQHVSLHYEV